MTEIFTPGTNPPLLDYALRVQPDPLVAGGRSLLVLDASYSGDDLVACQSIQLTLPVGTDASDLIDGSKGISTEPPAGWTAQVANGVVTFTPPGGSIAIDKNGPTFKVATVANAKAGTAAVGLTEWATDDGGASQQGGGAFAVPKFPADFSLGGLAPVPPDKLDYGHGERVYLTWVTSGTDVSCVLKYQPAGFGGPISVDVPNNPDPAGFETEPLTRSGSVTFTLYAEVHVLGQDNPLIASEQLTVSVEIVDYQLRAEPARVGVNGLTWLQWDAPDADHCLLDGTVLPARGSRYYVLSRTHQFTVTAVRSDGQREEKQVTVEVDPTIKHDHLYFGDQAADGVAGSNGYCDLPRFFGRSKPPVPAGHGFPGGSVFGVLQLPPLDTSGGSSRVLGLWLQAGAGGPGGFGEGADNGNGGDGGNALLTATFDPSLSPPAQYVITMTAGAGGKAGGPGASDGAHGVVTATIDGQPIHFI